VCVVDHSKQIQNMYTANIIAVADAQEDNILWKNFRI
jgi:hypothetical protein